MRVYCTSKNNGPSYSGASIVTMLYLGTSEHEAVKAAERFHKYERLSDTAYWPKEFPQHYSAIPATMDREIIHFYAVDGWWYSIVMFDLY
jgi:hypothetical protein